MPFVLVRVKEKRPGWGNRPDRCPYCGGEVLQRWGRGCSTLSDPDHESESQYRYRCEKCRRTFRFHPAEPNRELSKSLVRQIAGIVWALGMSSRSVVDTFSRLGAPLSRMTVWREGQRTIRSLAEKNTDFKKPFVIDDLYVNGITHKLGVVVVLDFGSGCSAVLGAVNGESPREVKAWLDQQLAGQPVEIIIGNTGQLQSYENYAAAVTCPEAVESLAVP